MGNCASSKDDPHSPITGGRGGTSKQKSPPASRGDRPTAHIFTSAAEQKKVAPEVNRTSPLPLPSIKAVEDFRHIASFGTVSVFTYDELRVATRSFRPDRIVGEGGFGVVYRGAIDENVRPGLKRAQVAVKVLNPNGYQGDKEWLAEVSYLGQYSHPNLVKLIGYCCEDEHRLLVYEYMASGCLDKLLFRRSNVPVPWSTRIKIALDAAKGLAFLHGAGRPVIYRDFKTSNILLDEEYNAKLSDFGLAKEGPVGDQTHVTTRVMGTYGYAAPEYIMTGHLTTRSDVYGYGVVLLELLIGRRIVERSRSGREHNLVDWARPLLVHNRKLLQIIDPKMKGQYRAKTIQKVAKLAYQCLSQNPKGRPIMAQVVEIIQAVRNLPECRGQDAFFLRRCGDVGRVVTLYDASHVKVKPAERGAEEEKSDAVGELEAEKGEVVFIEKKQQQEGIAQ